MNKDTGEFIKKYPAVIEAIVGILAVAFLIYTMRSLLIFGKTTLSHDNLLWNYPIFQFFAENIINGHFPLWDPFSHAGEPFYPMLGQVRLLEPITLLTIYFGHFISNDIVMLFNWNHFVKSLIMTFGVYIVFRPLTANLFVRLSLIPILLYSSFMLGSFREDFILQFLWIPFITYFLLRIIYYKDCRWHNWLLLSSLIGLNWQSYFFTGTWIFLLLFALGIMLFYKDLLVELFKARMIILKLSTAAVIILAMAMPNVVLMLEKGKYVFPARMVDVSKMQTPGGGPLPYESGTSSTKVDGINMPYIFIIFTGTFSTIWDFIQIIAPDGNNYVGWSSRTGWGKYSEAYMYLGLLPWAVALLGLVAGRHDLKRLWLLMLISFGLLMLGPPGGLHRLLYYIYPPMWFVRHTHTFVLFFVFAFLYFYVLGCNHIFYTWRDGNTIFNSHNSQGFFSRFIKSDKVCKITAFFVFSAFIIASVYFMTRMQYPATNYLFGFIILTFAAYWLIRKDLGEKGLYVSLIVSHIAIVLIFSANTFKFIKYILPLLGIPFALFIVMKPRGNFSFGFKRYTPIILLVIFSISLISDLVYSLRKSSSLYQGEKHPVITLNINTSPQPPFLPQNRLIEPHNYATYSEQGVRHLSLAYRQPFVFSPLMEPDYSASYVRVKKVFSGFTNKSFEDWVASTEGSSLPAQFTYHQDGNSGAAKKNIGIEGIKDGKTSVLLMPSTRRNSYIKYQTSEVEDIRGQYIRVSLWVKSQNKGKDAIQATFQIDSGPITLKSYDNSGDWEQIILGKYIDKDVAKITIHCNIKSFATAPAYFDGFDIEIIGIKPDFEAALKAKRWSSFLLLEKYFALINMDISPLVLEEMFAVGRPMFQFKQSVIPVKESESPSFLRQLGTAESVKLLKEAILIDEQAAKYLIRFRKLPKGYQNENQDNTDGRNFKEKKDASERDEKNKFTYTIEKYNYNSFEMKAHADNDGILYWADGYDKNWRAYVNGKEVAIYRANINFKAISIRKGANNITFTYNPFLFKIGIFVFYGMFVISILASMISGSFSVVTVVTNAKDKQCRK